MPKINDPFRRSARSILRQKPRTKLFGKKANLSEPFIMAVLEAASNPKVSRASFSQFERSVHKMLGHTSFANVPVSTVGMALKVMAEKKQIVLPGKTGQGGKRAATPIETLIEIKAYAGAHQGISPAALAKQFKTSNAVVERALNLRTR